VGPGELVSVHPQRDEGALVHGRLDGEAVRVPVGGPEHDLYRPRVHPSAVEDLRKRDPLPAGVGDELAAHRVADALERLEPLHGRQPFQVGEGEAERSANQASHREPPRRGVEAWIDDRLVDHVEPPDRGHAGGQAGEVAEGSVGGRPTGEDRSREVRQVQPASGGPHAEQAGDEIGASQDQPHRPHAKRGQHPPPRRIRSNGGLGGTVPTGLETSRGPGRGGRADQRRRQGGHREHPTGRRGRLRGQQRDRPGPYGQHEEAPGEEAPIAKLAQQRGVQEAQEGPGSQEGRPGSDDG